MSPMNPRLLRPLATGFNPKSIAGLFLWLDPSDESTLGNTSSGTGGASNNGPVKYLADKSGGGRHATQTGADSAAPTLLAGALNGRSVLGYDGGDSLAGTFGNLSLTGQTTFAVIRLATGAVSFARVFSQQLQSQVFDFLGTGHYLPILRNGTTNAVCSYAAGAARGSVSVSLDTWVVFASRHTGGEINNRTNLNAYATATSITLTGTFNQYRVGTGIGSGTDVAFWQDRIGELLSYNRSLSDTECNRVSSYLIKKYAIT
jgi:hypothetical protein